MLQTIIDNCLRLETTQIVVVQNVFEPIESYLEAISHFANAEFLHMYFVPIIIALSVRSYINVLTAAVCSELMNCLLKWLIAEDRPYWWVMETNAYTMFTRPNLRQTYLTCETSSGSPSGHSMLFATILFVAMQDALHTMPWYRAASNTVKYCTWNIFISLLTLVAISRMYFACHFLHQCLFGVVIGVSIGHIIRQPHLQRQLIDMRTLDALVIGIALVLLTVVVYFGQILLQIDPQWSVRKAFNWCKDPYFVKPETTPIYGLVRHFGLLFGMILCAPHVHRCRTRLELKWSLPVAVALIIANSILCNHIPRWNGSVIFYSCGFAANLIFTVALLVIVPYFGTRTRADRLREN